MVAMRKAALPAVAATAVVMLSACTTVNMTGDPTVSGLTRAQKELRRQAVALSETVWGKVSGSPSFFGSLAGMLINGKEEEPAGPGLVADSHAPGYAEAVAYIAQKESEYRTPDDQVKAVLADLRRKTIEAEALADAAENVLSTYYTITPGSYQAEQTRLAMAGSSSDLVQGLAQVREDKMIMETTIASARQQKATFESVQLALQQKHPGVDTRALEVELASFNQQINRLMAVSDALASLSLQGV